MLISNLILQFCKEHRSENTRPQCFESLTILADIIESQVNVVDAITCARKLRERPTLNIICNCLRFGNRQEKRIAGRFIREIPNWMLRYLKLPLPVAVLAKQTIHRRHRFSPNFQTLVVDHTNLNVVNANSAIIRIIGLLIDKLYYRLNH